MRSLRWMAGGLALVALDFRTEALDLLPDPLGWAMIAGAAWRLALTTPAALAVAAGVTSVADVTLPYRYVHLDPVTGEQVPHDLGVELDYPQHLRYGDVSGGRLVAMMVAMALAGVALWTLLRGLERLARSGGRAEPARIFRLIRWLAVGLWTAPYLAAAAVAMASDAGEFDPVWNNGLAYVTLAALAVFVALIIVLLLESNQAWALPPDSVAPSPWTARRRGPGDQAASS